MIEETLKHPSMPKKVDCEDTEFLSNDEQCRVRLAELTDSAQKLRLYYWAPNETISLNMKFDLLEAIKRRFDSEGIEIPYTYITVVQKESPNTKSKVKR
jgi:small-conductance mechanosensitive channel